MPSTCPTPPGRRATCSRRRFGLDRLQAPGAPGRRPPEGPTSRCAPKPCPWCGVAPSKTTAATSGWAEEHLDTQMTGAILTCALTLATDRLEAGDNPGAFDAAVAGLRGTGPDVFALWEAGARALAAAGNGPGSGAGSATPPATSTHPTSPASRSRSRSVATRSPRRAERSPARRPRLSCAPCRAHRGRCPGRSLGSHLPLVWARARGEGSTAPPRNGPVELRELLVVEWELGPDSVAKILRPSRRSGRRAISTPSTGRCRATAMTRAGIRQVLCLKVKAKLVPRAVVVRALLATSVWVETSLYRDGLSKPRYSPLTWAFDIVIGAKEATCPVR